MSRITKSIGRIFIASMILSFPIFTNYILLWLLSKVNFLNIEILSNWGLIIYASGIIVTVFLMVGIWFIVKKITVKISAFQKMNSLPKPIKYIVCYSVIFLGALFCVSALDQLVKGISLSLNAELFLALITSVFHSGSVVRYNVLELECVVKTVFEFLIAKDTKNVA
ncbi:MAG: hypothetical protein LRZ99_02050 [Desulfotomaculum sp.]|nr:hypothetical protein [Desulfotomaculum sp.]